MIKTKEQLITDAKLAIADINRRLQNKTIVGVLQVDNFPFFLKEENKLYNVNMLKSDLLNRYDSTLNKEGYINKFVFYPLNIKYADIKLNSLYFLGTNYLFEIQLDCIFRNLITVEKKCDVQAGVTIIDLYQYQKELDSVEMNKVLYNEAELLNYLVLGVPNIGYLIVLFDNIEQYFYDETLVFSNGETITVSKDDYITMLHNHFHVNNGFSAQENVFIEKFDLPSYISYFAAEYSTKSINGKLIDDILNDEYSPNKISSILKL